MFKHIKQITLALALTPFAFFAANTAAQAAVEIGQPAPNFTAIDIHGETFTLADKKGETIVLEWTNHDCPFVKKHYSTNNMQNTQKEATENGITWVSIVSFAPGKQGHVTAEQAKTIEETVGAQATTRILDESGDIGKLFDAKTTPHMFVIDKEGNVAYAGAIDDNPSPSPESVTGSKNLVLAALEDLSAGRSVAIPRTAPYGCSVKY